MGVDPESLSDKWTCELNTWDPALASCHAPEDLDDPLGDHTGYQLGNKPKATGHFSYRDIVFSPDMKLRPPFLEGRPGGSIFANAYRGLCVYAGEAPVPRRAE